MKSRTPALLRLAFAATAASLLVLVATVLLAAPASAEDPIDGCISNPPRTPGQYIVFGVAIDDPDGGLVMRSAPGVHAPRVGVLAPTSGRIYPTGQCWTSPTGSAWYQVWTDAGGAPVWVSSNFLQLTVPACLLETQYSSPALSPLNTGQLMTSGFGRAVRDGDQIAFLNMATNSYQMLSADAAVLGSSICAPGLNRPPLDPGPPSFDLPPALPNFHGHVPGIVVCG